MAAGACLWAGGGRNGVVCKNYIPFPVLQFFLFFPNFFFVRRIFLLTMNIFFLRRNFQMNFPDDKNFKIFF